MVFIPQEIVDLIIADVDSKDSDASLRACALTAQRFLVPSRRRLFCTIKIPKSPDFRWCRWLRNLCEVFTDSPDVSTYVRKLAITLVPEMLHDEDAAAEKLALLFRSLPNLVSLFINGFEFSWSRMPPYLVSSLTGLMSSPALLFLGLKNISNVPSHIITLTASVSTLYLSHIVLAREKITPATTTPGIIEHLIFHAKSHNILRDSMTPVFALLLKSGHLTGLIRLNLSPDKDFNCVTLLAACSQTVQHLNMDLIAPAPRLPHFSALRTLTIKVSLWRTRNIPADLVITLQQLPLAAPRLEDIALAFAPESERARRNSPWVAGPQWTLDPKLEMPLLRAVRCSIVFDTERGISDIITGFRNCMNHLMPGLQTAGILTFT